MIALINFDELPVRDDNMKLIKLIRQISPKSTSREIDDEKSFTYYHNRLSSCDMESR